MNEKAPSSVYSKADRARAVEFVKRIIFYKCCTYVTDSLACKQTISEDRYREIVDAYIYCMEHSTAGIYDFIAEMAKACGLTPDELLAQPTGYEFVTDIVNNKGAGV